MASRIATRSAPPPDKFALIRRAYYDLTGLPPTPAEVDAFINDKSPDAYEKLIDNLLNSPRYGEQWGRHWLDLVRFAETNSFERDGVKPNAWRYRDYVIKSFNADKTFAQFVREQLAGDEIAPSIRDALDATMFLRHGVYEENQRDGEGQLRELLLNLVLNAIEAAGAAGAIEAAGAGGWVRIEFDHRADATVVRVLDSGPGVPPEMSERLFEPFATGRPDGIGLGLTVAQRIAEVHGGAIRYLQERPTCFEVILPPAPVADSSTNEQQGELPSPIEVFP